MKDMENKEVRLDKWLWAARFFKTRSLAHAAIESGKIYIAGVKAKPSRLIKIGNEIQVTNDSGVFTVIVKGILEQRGSASIAATLYAETEGSRIERLKIYEEGKLSPVFAPSARPNSKDRRALRKLKESVYK